MNIKNIWSIIQYVYKNIRIKIYQFSELFFFSPSILMLTARYIHRFRHDLMLIISTPNASGSRAFIILFCPYTIIVNIVRNERYSTYVKLYTVGSGQIAAQSFCNILLRHHVLILLHFPCRVWTMACSHVVQCTVNLNNITLLLPACFSRGTMIICYTANAFDLCPTNVLIRPIELLWVKKNLRPVNHCYYNHYC